MNRSIIVLGGHRSGTSLVAGILHHLGIHMGTRLRDPDVHNPTGYWEDLDWRDLNRALINGAGGTWYRPPSHQAITRIAAQYTSWIQHLADRRAECPVWGLKDPRTCLTVHALHRFFPNPRYIVVIREEEGAVASLMARAELRGYYESPSHWLNLVATYSGRVRKFLTAHPDLPKLTVQFELLVSPSTCRSVIDNIAAFVSVGHTRGRVDIAHSFVETREWMDDEITVPL